MVERFGRARVMFGSDFPGVRFACSYAEAIAWPERLDFLSPIDRREIMSTTPQRLWRFPQPDV